MEEAQYRRVRYYNRLQNQTGINLDVLVKIVMMKIFVKPNIFQSVPDHVLPVEFYQIHFLGVSPAAGRQSSLVTM